MKAFLTSAAAVALLAGVTIAAAQSPDGRPADEKNAKSQSQERGPMGETGGSTKNPPAATTGSNMGTTGGRMGPDGRPADEKTPKAQGEERNPNGTTGGSQTMPSR